MTVLLLLFLIAFVSVVLLFLTPVPAELRDEDATLDDFLEGTDR